MYNSDMPNPRGRSIGQLVLPCDEAGGAFSHSGDLGDVIYGMGAINLWLKFAGLQAAQLTLFNHTAAKWLHPSHYPREAMTPAKAESLMSLLNAQDWIEARYDCVGQPSRLAHFREWGRDPTVNTTLVRLHLAALGVFCDDIEYSPWLKAAPASDSPPILINRTERYQSNAEMWTSLLGEFGHLIGFVGTETEWRVFQDAFHCKLPFIHTPNLLALARCIAGCRVFVGNQSCALAVTHGLGKNAVIEVYPAADNASKFGRSNIMRVLPGQHPDFAVIDQWCDGLSSGLPASPGDSVHGDRKVD